MERDLHHNAIKPKYHLHSFSNRCDRLYRLAEEVGGETKHGRWHRYFGLFLLQKRHLRMHAAEWRRLFRQV